MRDIREIPEEKVEEKLKRGGYFEVSRKKCEIEELSGKKFVKDLACKTTRPNKKTSANP